MKLGRLEIVYIGPNSTVNKPLKGNYYKALGVLTSMLTFVMAQPVYAQGVYEPLPKIREAENLVLEYGFAVGRLVCVVMAMFEIIKAIKDGDTNAFWGILVKYAIALASFKMLPWVFDLIAGFFG